MMVAAIFSIVIYVGTLNIISLGFLNLCFVISRRSPSLVLISVVSLFISSSLPVSIKIPFSLIVLIALVPNLMSVGMIFLFSWSFISSGVRVSSFGVRVNLYLCLFFFGYLWVKLSSFTARWSTRCSPLLVGCCRWSRNGATCLVSSFPFVLSVLKLFPQFFLFFYLGLYLAFHDGKFFP